MSLAVRCCLGGVLALAMAWRGLRHGSLSTSGAVAAAAVGTLHMACGLQYGWLLIAFYLSSSKVTKWQQDIKQKLEADVKKDGQRSAAQVLCNSSGGCLSALAAAACWAAGPAWACQHWVAKAAFLGHYACCCGDTWASEVGILSSSPPRLITSGRKVPAGTNGGVTQLGLACSAAAGLLMGVCFGLSVPAEQQPSQMCLQQLLGGQGVGWSQQVAATAHPVQATLKVWAPLGVAAALLGSLLDSLLGATLQFSGSRTATGQVVNRPAAGVVHISGLDLLSNNAVNALSAALTAAGCVIGAKQACCVL